MQTQDEKDLLMKYLNEKSMGTRFRQQRATQWMMNEQIYMGNVAKSNMTRSNLSLPHLFDTVHSISAQLGQGALIDFTSMNDKNKNAPEILKALFDDDMDTYNLDGETDVSKVEAGIYGRAVYKFIPRKNGAHFECVDTLSFYVSPSTKRIGQAFFCGQEFIDKTIEEIEADAEDMGYDKSVIATMRMEGQGTSQKLNTTQEESFRRLRMAVLGLNTSEFDKENAYQITEHYTYWKKEIYCLSVANDSYILRAVPIKELGLKSFPFYSWATHPRGITFWTTSPADIARDPNLAMSTSMNQQIDNSTYKNFASMLVKSSSGLKQSSIVPRPMGITSVVVAPGEHIQDNVMQLIPPDIAEASVVIQSIKQFSDSASGVGNPTIPKGQLTATQYASVVAKASQKNDPMRREFLRCMKEMADCYADYVTHHMVEPRDVKVYVGTPITIQGVDKENFEYQDEFGETKTIKFLAKAIPEETEDDNRAIKQKAAIDMYNAFKNDPLVPGQQYLRERVLREFEISPEEMAKLLTPDVATQMAPGPDGTLQPVANTGLPPLDTNTVASAAGIGAQVNNPTT